MYMYCNMCGDGAAMGAKGCCGAYAMPIPGLTSGVGPGPAPYSSDDTDSAGGGGMYIWRGRDCSWGTP